MASEPVPYIVIEPGKERLPIVLSIPHSGTSFPKHVQRRMKREYVDHPVDTDWFVDRLYDFAPELGIAIIKARYSRYVIDLNRDPENKPLYDDGRILTELLPTRTFLGKQLYTQSLPGPDQISIHLERYYWPYFGKVQSLLDDLRRDFPNILLWDCHSIRQRVPSIRKDPFPDLILGNQDGRTAHTAVINAALDGLGAGGRYTVAHNDPFRGGYISRYFGKPEIGVHALQLEMTQVNYMDEDRCLYDPARADLLRDLLRDTFVSLAQILKDM